MQTLVLFILYIVCFWIGATNPGGRLPEPQNVVVMVLSGIGFILLLRDMFGEPMDNPPTWNRW